MRTTGEYTGTLYDTEGRTLIQFSVDDREEIQKLEDTKGKKLVIDAQILRQKRSLNANAYFWQLVDKMAKRIGTTKEALYRLEISRYGVFTDMEVIKDALPTLERYFRVVERFNDGYEEESSMIRVRCYYGSSKFNSSEMAALIDGTVRDAKDLGVDVLTEDEIKAMLAAWKGGTE